MMPRRNPEIVVVVLMQGGGWGKNSALLAAKVIKAYVEKQRTRPTEVAKAQTPAADHADYDGCLA